MKKCPVCGAEEDKDHRWACSLGREKKERMKQGSRAIQKELHELDRDKARLDWLDKRWLILHLNGAGGVLTSNIRGKLREAIDAAMKEEP